MIKIYIDEKGVILIPVRTNTKCLSSYHTEDTQWFGLYKEREKLFFCLKELFVCTYHKKLLKSQYCFNFNFKLNKYASILRIRVFLRN